MNSLSDIKDYLSRTLDSDAAKLFDEQVDGLMYLSKSLALGDLVEDPEDIKEKFSEVVRGFISDMINMYLAVHHSHDGVLDINVCSDKVYDRDMSEIVAIKNMRTKQSLIVALVVTHAMDTYHQGRILVEKMSVKCVTHDYGDVMTIDPLVLMEEDVKESSVYVPMEAIEIEIMRLERRLPNLSAEEGEQLSLLYERLRS